MNSIEKNIELGVGTLGIQFGMTRQEVEKVLGKPDEIENYPSPDEEDGATEVWHYDEHELSATFDELDDWNLAALAVSSPDYLFQGVTMIGLSREEAIQQIELMDIGDIEIEDVPIEEDDEVVEYQIASIYDAALNLWFEDGSTTEVQWGAFYDDDESIEN